ncbi:hypothetical protein DFJ63DRAFT_333543 [Scheffersomyces coipomensis]|uniref:uncharacterized protein n=1 Tax=Scheffersomyces coipomensis TaxID=1788519 RepID=UPI00315C5AAD
MVVRYMLRSVIHKLPYSDHLPSIVDTILSENKPNNNNNNSNPTNNDLDLSITPLSPSSPKERIHSKLINNRSTLNPVDETDELEYDRQQQQLEALQEVENEDDLEGGGGHLLNEDYLDDELTAVNYLNYVDTCETIPTYTNLGINKLSGNRSVLNTHSRRESLNINQNQTNNINPPQLLQPFPDNGSTTLIDSTNSSTVSNGKSKPIKDNPNQSMEERNLRIKQYLNDQNTKFDQLINNNLSIVFKDCPPNDNNHDLESVYSNQSNYYDSTYEFNNNEEGESDQSSSQSPQNKHHSLMYYVYINTTNKLLSNVPFGSYLIKRRKISLPLPSFVKGTNDDASSSNATMSNMYKTPPMSTTDFNDQLENKPDQDQDVENQIEPGEDEEQMEQQVLQGLKLELFLDSLDQQTKLTLFNQLQSEFTSTNTNTNIKSPQSSNFIEIKYNEDDIFLDKVQTFLLISVKIFITSLKLFIPISQYLYYKFKNNQLYIFNNHNLIILFNKMLKCMDYIETKLNMNDELIDKIYNQEYIEKEMKYKSNNQQVQHNPLHVNYNNVEGGGQSNGGAGVPHEEQFDEIYQDLSLNLSKFINDQIMENIINNDKFNIINNKFDESSNLDSIWRKSIMDYLVARYLKSNQTSSSTAPKKKIPPPQQLLRKDPNLVKYFSPRSSSPATGGESMIGASSPTRPTSSNLRGRTNPHPLSKSDSSSSSDDNLNDMSVFGIAQQFASELN